MLVRILAMTESMKSIFRKVKKTQKTKKDNNPDETELET